MEFQPIPGAPGYEVNARGEVGSYHVRGIGKCIGNSARPLKPIYRPKTGYLYVHIRIDGKRRKVPIHEAVLRAFVGPRPEGLEACHNDGYSLNNTLENLRWDTPKANQQDSVKHGTKSRGEKVATKLTETSVREIKKQVKSGKNVAEIAKDYNVAFQTVYKIMSGQMWAHVIR